jgi:hypothetical protein
MELPSHCSICRRTTIHISSISVAQLQYQPCPTRYTTQAGHQLGKSAVIMCLCTRGSQLTMFHSFTQMQLVNKTERNDVCQVHGPGARLIHTTAEFQIKQRSRGKARRVETTVLYA